MKVNFAWTKGLFSSIYQIYSDGRTIGSLEDKTLSKSVKGIFNGKEYIFITHGFFKQNTEIIDGSDNNNIGMIEYNNWMTKAEISVNGKIIKWKYDNIWNTQWSLCDSDGVIMTFNGSTTRGQIDSKVDDGILVLSGLLVTNYYWQITMFIVLFAVFIPIMTF